MKKNKIIGVIGFVICCNTTVLSQGFLKKLTDKAANAGSDLILKKSTEKTEETIDDKVKKKDKSSNSKNNSYGKEQDIVQGNKENYSGINSYSKFDFVSGKKIIYAENFEQDAIGEFPLKWFTNGSAEVVTVDGLEGRWLKLVAGSTLTPTMKFPPNFILEYDLVLNMPVDPKSGAVTPFPGWLFRIYDGGNKNLKLSYDGHKLNNMLTLKTSFSQKYAEVSLDGIEKKVPKISSDRSQLDGFNQYYNGGVVHIAMTAQGERLRVWFNEEKVLDIPVAVAVNHNFNQIQFSASKRNGMPAFYIGNFKLSEGAEDSRSKLMDEGHFVTTGIQFDSGSDKIKPVSYGILKEIAAAIKDNSIKVKIIGHTDDQGSSDANLTLSKRRSEAVKNTLVKDFKIDSSVIQTDGQGSSKPVGDNKTSTGKAQNRRVEFIKL